MIWHEAKENAAFFLTHVQHSDINIQIAPLSKLNKMAALFIKLFKKFGPGLSHTKNPERNGNLKQMREHHRANERTSSRRTGWNFPSRMKSVSLTSSLSDITASLLDDVSDCFYKKIQSEILSEIQSLTSSLINENGKKINIFIPSGLLKCGYAAWCSG